MGLIPRECVIKHILRIHFEVTLDESICQIHKCKYICDLQYRTKLWNNSDYYFWKRSLLFTKVAFIWTKKIVKYYCYLNNYFLCEIVKCNFIPAMQSWIFRIITPVFSVTWSSEIILICWFAAQETFLIIINVENSCCFMFLWKRW